MASSGRATRITTRASSESLRSSASFTDTSIKNTSAVALPRLATPTLVKRSSLATPMTAPSPYDFAMA